MEESEMVSELLGGAGGEREEGSDQDRAAPEEPVGGSGGEERENESEGEAEDDVVELVWRRPQVFSLFLFHH